MNYFIIDEDQLTLLRRMSRRLFTEQRMDGDQMRDFAQYLDSIDTDCHQMPAYPGGLPKESTTT
jgi:hypothetical protein